MSNNESNATLKTQLEKCIWNVEGPSKNGRILLGLFFFSFSTLPFFVLEVTFLLLPVFALFFSYILGLKFQLESGLFNNTIPPSTSRRSNNSLFKLVVSFMKSSPTPFFYSIIGNFVGDPIRFSRNFQP